MNAPTISDAQQRTNWAHPSVLALLAAHPGQTDPEAIVRARAREMVREAKSLGWTGPPFDLELLAELWGIKVRQANLGNGTDALIRALPNGRLEILWHEGTSPARKNFSIAHEISHTFFPDCYEVVRCRSEARDRFDSERELEYLCNIGAAELLFPIDDFLSDLATTPLDPDGLNHLRQRYAASREAAAIRMMRLTDQAAAVAFLTYRLKPSEQHQLARGNGLGREVRPKLRIDLMAASPSFPYGRLYPHQSIPESSALYDLVRDAPPFTTEGTSEEWPFDTRDPVVCSIRCQAIPPDAECRPRVVAFLRSGETS